MECNFTIVGITHNRSTGYIEVHAIEPQIDVKMGLRPLLPRMFDQNENLAEQRKEFLNDWKGPGVYKCQCAEEYFINKNNEERKAIKIVKIISYEGDLSMSSLIP